MRAKSLRAVLGVVCVLALAMSVQAGEAHRLGAGGHYWTTVDNLEAENIDRHGFSWMGSYQYWPSWVGAELDVEWFPDGYAGADKDVYEPQAYVLVGRTLYGAVGIGGYYSDDTWGDNPFYALRAGLNIELLASLYLDLNANYRFEDWSNLNSSDIDSDTITLGVVARIAF
ncbi:MAG: outer membrane beta-barrel protein [Lentisphaerae bacterium]|nr:outer membrane beta-barrel protein [Lentisphaerota bacterium]